MDASYAERFRGVIQLLGPERFSRLTATRFVVVGLGGVGSWVAEGLARSGAAHLVLWDLDDICVNNTNRQIHTSEHTYGRLKVEAMRDRVQQFHPSCRVEALAEFYSAETAPLLSRWSRPESSTQEPHPHVVVVDAIDSVASKAMLVAQCLKEGCRVVTCGAAGGRHSPAALRTGTLAQSHSDPLLRDLRRRLRKDWGLGVPDYGSVAAVYSTETLDPSCAVQGRRMDCAGGLGSAVYVTATMGFLAVERAVHLAVTRDALSESWTLGGADKTEGNIR